MNEVPSEESVIMEALFKRFDGGRVVRVRPDEFSLPMGEDDDFPTFCELRVIEAVRQWRFAFRAGPDAENRAWTWLRSWYLDGLTPNGDRAKFYARWGSEAVGVASAVVLIRRQVRKRLRALSASTGTSTVA